MSNAYPMHRSFDHLEVDGYVVDELIIDGVNVSKFDLQPLNENPLSIERPIYSLNLTDEDRERIGV